MSKLCRRSWVRLASARKSTPKPIKWGLRSLGIGLVLLVISVVYLGIVAAIFNL